MERLWVILRWSLSNLLVIAFFLLAHISWRYLKLKFGKRIGPSADQGILVTGASSGIGLNAAKHLHSLGFSVFAAYFNELETGYKELADLAASSSKGKLFLVRLDVTSKSSIEEAAKLIEKLCFEHDIKLCRVINNAGIAKDGPFEWTSEESIIKGLDTNLKGLMLVTKQFIGRIVENKGRVINLSSGLHQIPFGGASVYGSTKSAIAYFSEALNEDLRIYGASCHAILPGNLIINSNIFYSRAQSLQESKKKLSDAERQLYHKSITLHSSTLDKVVSMKLRSEQDPEQIAKIYNFKLPENFKIRGRNSSKAKLGMQLAKVDGRVESLQDRSFLEVFEQAVCLEDPPRRLYAGNFIYCYLIGPQMEFLPPILGSFIGRLTAILWVRQLGVEK